MEGQLIRQARCDDCDRSLPPGTVAVAVTVNPRAGIVLPWENEFLQGGTLSMNDNNNWTAPLRIGDGTAPPGFPAYGAIQLNDGTIGVRCNFRRCHHKGTIGPPAVLECGKECPCPCCQCLQGKTVHGVTIGGTP